MGRAFHTIFLSLSDRQKNEPSNPCYKALYIRADSARVSQKEREYGQFSTETGIILFMLETILAPSILAADFANLGRECQEVLALGAHWLHFDVMDGHFVPNITFGLPILNSLRKFLPEVFLDCHLMVTEPAKWIQPFHKAGASGITFHIESQMPEGGAQELCRKIRKMGMKVGVSIRPKTELRQVLPLLQNNAVDMLLVMTVQPGFGGQKFMKEQLKKVEEARARFPLLLIQVDGGIDQESSIQSRRAGSNVLVAGTSIFESKDRRETIASMIK